MTSGIYEIYSNQFPERIYIGSAINLPARWKRHRRELNRKKHFNAKLTNHVNKHGIDDLIFQVLELCPKNQLIEREQYWLNLYQTYFNINPVAGSRLGAKHSNQTKLRISKASKASTKENIVSRYARLTKTKP